MAACKNHCVRLVPPAPALQYFPLTSLQLQPPATSQVIVFFSHTTPALASSSSLPNAVNRVNGSLHKCKGKLVQQFNHMFNTGSLKRLKSAVKTLDDAVGGVESFFPCPQSVR